MWCPVIEFTGRTGLANNVKCYWRLMKQKLDYLTFVIKSALKCPRNVPQQPVTICQEYNLEYTCLSTFCTFQDFGNEYIYDRGHFNSKTIKISKCFLKNGLKGVHLIWQLVTVLIHQCQWIGRGGILPIELSSMGRFCCFRMGMIQAHLLTE